MSDVKQAIEITALMYEMQATAKQIFGETYPVKVATWMEFIRKASEKLKCGYIQTALYLSNPHAGHGETLTDGDTLLLAAALVELAEAERRKP